MRERLARVVSAPRPLRAVLAMGLRRAHLVDRLPTTLTYRDGIRMRFRGGAIGMWLDPDGHHRHDDLDFLKGYLRPGDVCVDVGANVGLLTVAAGRYVGAGGRVYSFEPHPRVYRVLVDNVHLNGLAHVRCFNCAVAAEPGSARLTDDPRHDRNAVTDVAGVEVAVRTLDDAVPADPVALLKIDVEGYERFVLEGARETLARTACVYLECWNDHFRRFGYTTADVIEQLAVAGLATYRFDRGGGGLEPIRDPSSAGAALENLVAIRDVADFTARTGAAESSAPEVATWGAPGYDRPLARGAGAPRDSKPSPRPCQR